jgi:hypothetical protein
VAGDYKCAFSATLTGGEFGCRHARQVTRRGGPDIACGDEQSHLVCARLLVRLKEVALPAFAVDDDLLSMPHSVMVKVQFGGLLGLQGLLTGASQGASGAAPVDDIARLVERAVQFYQGVEAIPCAELAADMTSFKLKRRRSR